MRYTPMKHTPMRYTHEIHALDDIDHGRGSGKVKSAGVAVNSICIASHRCTVFLGGIV